MKDDEQETQNPRKGSWSEVMVRVKNYFESLNYFESSVLNVGTRRAGSYQLCPILLGKIGHYFESLTLNEYNFAKNWNWVKMESTIRFYGSFFVGMHICLIYLYIPIMIDITQVKTKSDKQWFKVILNSQSYNIRTVMRLLHISGSTAQLERHGGAWCTHHPINLIVVDLTQD